MRSGRLYTTDGEIFSLARATQPPSDALSAGLRIGPYLLLVPLGSGGSGRVWAVARTGQLGFTKRLALKVMRGDKLGNERARQRFDREARLGAQLRHSGLRAVHELGSHQGRPYMVMSWVDAALDELLQHAPGHRLEPAVVCWLGMQACLALAAAHGYVNAAGQPRPVVHGDVSPGNILLARSGHVLLSDLAAADVGSASSAKPGRPGAFFGKLGYAAPESVRGEPADGRADLFALGCVLYEALCGAPAFEGDDERALLFQVLQQSPRELQSRVSGIPDDVAQVVRRALQRNASERFQSAREMRAALSACVANVSDFELERHTAAVIERVLGERIRERERAISSTLQQFSPSALERTDTLPIGNALRPGAASTLRIGTDTAPPATRQIAPAPAAAHPHSRSQRLALALVGVLAAAAGSAYLGYGSPRGARDEASQSALQPAPSLAPELSPQPASPQPASPVVTQPPPSPPSQSEAPERPANPSARPPRGESAPGTARPAPASERPSSPPRPSARPLSDEPAAGKPAQEKRKPERPARRPFDWNFPDDPYAKPAPP